MIFQLFSNPILFLGWLLAILIAIMSHEVAHGFAAMRNGDSTAKYMGRMNFNPARHFDLMGVAMFLVLGFGYAKPVPIDPRNFHNYRKGYFQVAIAGVLTNLILAFLAYPLLILTMKYMPDLMMFDDFLVFFLQYMVLVNIWLMVFNLLPIYPLDGFRLVELFSKPRNRYVQFMYRYSNMVFIAYLLMSYMGPRFGLNFLNPVSFLGNYVFQGIGWIWGLIL